MKSPPRKTSYKSTSKTKRRKKKMTLILTTMRLFTLAHCSTKVTTLAGHHLCQNDPLVGQLSCSSQSSNVVWVHWKQKTGS